MKKLSKVLLLTLVLALACGTVFATVASAATTSENEQALLDAVADNDSIVRFVEDFTDETIDVSANSDTNTSSSPVYSNLSVGVTFGSWRSVAARGVAYGELRLTGALGDAENPWIAIGGTSEEEGMTRVTGSAGNKYAVYEWDMMTATQYPAGFGIYFSAVNAAGKTPFISEVAVSNENGTLTVGDKTVSLGAAGEWHHYTVVLHFVHGTQACQAVGAFYQDGQLIAMLDAPIASSGTGKNNTETRYVESLRIGYYDQTANYALDSSICVDNAVITQMGKGYEDGTDNVAPVFDSTVDDLTTLNASEYVYTADYQFPEEYAFAGVKADGSYEYYPNFEAAYAAFVAGDVTMVELYEDTEASITSPVVIKAPAGVTFTDTNADTATKQAKITAVDAEGNTYYTFTNSDKKISYSFYKTPEGGEATVYEFGVGNIASVPDGFVPVDYISNPNDNSPKLQFNETWTVYKVVGTEKTASAFALVTEAEIDAGVTYEVRPNYDVVVPFFEVLCADATPVPYFNNEEYATAFETLADGATVKLYKDVGFTATPVVAGTVYVDMNGCALYQSGTEKLNFFDISEGATLYLYSSVPGAKLYGGASTDGACLLANYTGKGAVHVGYKSTEAKDAYLDNVTAYVGALVDNAVAESTLDIVGVSFYVVNGDYDALVGFAPAAQGITVSMDRVAIYNNLMNAKPIASFDSTLGGNVVSITDSVIYNKVEKLVTLVGTNTGANTVTFTAVTVHGNIKGEADLKITLESGCRFTSIDADTVSVAESASFVNDNEKGAVSGQYPGSGMYNNRFNMSTLEDEASPIYYYLTTPDQLAENFCEVEWFFDAKLDSIKEYWVRGIVPDFRHEYPISDERITYSYENVTIPTIGEDAATLKIEALEVAEYGIVGFAHNLSVYIGMDYYFYIPVQSAVVGVRSNGGDVVDVADLKKTEDGVYYIFTVAELEVRNFATVAYELEFFVKTARGYETTLSTSTSPVSYLEGLFNSDETTKETKDLVITFMDYLVKAAAFLSTEADPVNVDSVKEILKGKAVPGTFIDYISDEGGIRYGLSGAHLRLTSKPEYVFTLRSGFVGTITIDDVEYVIEAAGQYQGKNYIAYELSTMGDMADELAITVKGTIGENQIDEAGKYCLANYYISQMDENYNTPEYISALYVYVKYAKAYENAMN